MMKIKSKPLKYRKRSSVTNYYTRYKTLTNYDKILRLTFYKNRKFMVAGLYYTSTLKQPDICLKSYDSRVLLKDFKASDTQYLKQLSREVQFGKLIGKDFNELLKTFSKQFKDRKLILDVCARKKRRFFAFVEGFNKESEMKIPHGEIVPPTYKPIIESLL